MIVINSISDKYFELNGVKYAKIYQPLKKSSDSLGLISVFDSKNQIIVSEPYYDFRINGITPSNQLEAISLVLDNVFSFEVSSEVDRLLTEKLSTGGYTGTALQLKEEIDSKVFTGAKSYQTLVELNSVSPVPINGTPGKVVNDGDNNGFYSVVSGSWVKDSDIVLSEFDGFNSNDAVSSFAIASYLNKLKLNENFIDLRQTNPYEFILLQDNNRLEFGNQITIAKTGLQSKIQIPNETVVGEKYILLINIENIKNVHPNCTGLRFFNYSQNLFFYSLTETRKIIPIVFTSSVNGVLQILANGNVGSTSGIDEDTDLITFDTQFVGCIEWTQEKEDYWTEISNIYQGGGFENRMVYQSIIAEKAKEIEGEIFPENSFDKIGALANKIKGEFPDGMKHYDSFSENVGTVINSSENGILTISAIEDYSIDGTPRAWFGVDFQNSLYASEERNFVIAVKGVITTQNASDWYYQKSSNPRILILQDLEDGVATTFETLIELSYSEGSNSGNGRYTYFSLKRRDSSIDEVSVNVQFEAFSVFDKIEGFTLQDYLNASNDDLIVPKNVKAGLATEEFVNNEIQQATSGNSKLDANDVNPVFDIEMILSGGQSLNVGGGASSALNDFKNTPSFALGTGLFGRSFGTEAEKNAFFGTEFVLLEDNNSNESYPPINASLTTMLSLLEKENKVDVSNFGYQIMPFAWGVSGSSITSMEKGTTAYNNMIEVVTKAKQFANNEGKTFGVRSMNWYHGEADRQRTKQWYYDRMRQLFIDINTDIKLITGQTIDIQFFSYQTSGWLGRLTSGVVLPDIDIQEAQVQVASDFDNVHIAGAMYQFDYSDTYHPSDRAVVGLQTGVAMKRVLIDGEEWVDFKPISHEVLNANGKYYTRIKFDVPVKPMRFDVSGGLYNNPRGKQVNFGFEVLNGSGVEVQTEEPFIMKGDTVVLTTNVNPSGFNVRYAVNGHDGGGNLCDSQNIIVRNKGIDYNIDNFAVAFSEFIID